MGNKETTVALDKYKGFGMIWYKVLTFVILPIIALACLLGAVAHILTFLNCVVLGGGLEGILDILAKIKLTTPAVYANYLDGATIMGSYMVADIIAAVLLGLCGVLLIISDIKYLKLCKGTALFMAGVLICIPVALFIYETTVVITSNGSVTFGLWSMGCLVALIPFIALNSIYFKKRETVMIN